MVWPCKEKTCGLWSKEGRLDGGKSNQSTDVDVELKTL